MNARFVWLMRREWMQHRVGWILLAAVPLLLALLLIPFAEVRSAGEIPHGFAVAALGMLVYGWLCALFIAAAVVFQAAGTARRDQQDRSIEFWMSLPVGHVQSAAATLLMHLLLVPLALMLVSMLAAQVVALAVLWRFGVAGFLGEIMRVVGTEWWTLSGLMMIRMVLGVALAVLWASPLLVAVMAASVWLKRWGVPVVGLVAFLGPWMLARLTGISFPLDAVSAWMNEAGRALVPASDFDPKRFGLEPGMSSFHQWSWDSTLALLRSAADPHLAAGLAIAAEGFALLVWRRMR